MEKLAMRVYLADLETRIDVALQKWKKHDPIQNGEVAQIEWQFEQSRILLDVFWHDDNEHVNLQCISPRMHWKHEWQGLTKGTAAYVMDRVGNFAQIIMSRHHK